MGQWLLRLTVNILAFLRLTVNFLAFLRLKVIFFPLRLPSVSRSVCHPHFIIGIFHLLFSIRHQPPSGQHFAETQQL